MAAPVPGQSPPEKLGDFSVPFDTWVAAGRKTDIPWSVSVSRPELRFDQRLGVAILVEVPGKHLAKLGEQQDLFLLARIGDQQGRWIEQGWLRQQIESALPKNGAVVFHMPFYVTPGQYNLALVLYDRKSRRFSVHKQKIRAKELKRDPFPGAFASLPRVQWLPTNDPEALINAKIKSRMTIPVRTRRPLHFEIIFILGDFEQRGMRRFAAYSSLDFAFSALHVLSQLEVERASFHVTVLDATRRNIVYEQKAGRVVDWAPINKAIRGINPGVIDLGALEGFRENALFVRAMLGERISEPLHADPSAGPDQRPLRVVLLLGSPMLFPSGTVREPMVIEDARDLLFFQLRFQPFGGYFPLADDFEKVLKSANPRRFDIARPLQFREGLAEIIGAIEKHTADIPRTTGTKSPL